MHLNILFTYFDYLYRAGVTFKYTLNGSIGLATGKKAIILNAREGGIQSHLRVTKKWRLLLSKTHFTF
ncbi:NAD(P)H-dependent oxidoreductase [Peribacillus sp. NPDC096447]|uniref:NAD(P)H-dependent oxidoreductase n=1 Tax=Peribacillus sp. NPDC096447 TaxID=3364394 RepID=UPI0038080095